MKQLIYQIIHGRHGMAHVFVAVLMAGSLVAAVAVPAQSAPEYHYTFIAATAGLPATPGETSTLSIALRNSGSAAWSNTDPNPVRLGTVRGQDRASHLHHASWVNSQRPGTFAGTAKTTSSGLAVAADGAFEFNPSTTVAPGQVAIFRFTATAPPTSVRLREYFAPVVEGRAWMADIGIFWPVNLPESYRAAYAGQSANPSVTKPGVTAMTIDFTNTGGVTWTKGGNVRLGTWRPQDRTSPLAALNTPTEKLPQHVERWMSPNRTGHLIGRLVNGKVDLSLTTIRPGDTGRFVIAVDSSQAPVGNYREYFRLVADGVTWFDDIGAYKDVTVREAVDPANFTMKAGREFAADSYIHRLLANNAEIDPRSGALVANLNRQLATYYSGMNVNTHQYAPPIYVVGPTYPTQKVLAKRDWEPNWFYQPFQNHIDNVPIPDNFSPSAGTDQEAIIYQPETGKYWEFWRIKKSGAQTTDSTGRTVDQWQAAWGGRIDDLGANPGYFDKVALGWRAGAAATGIPYLGGTMTIAEQRAGVINHALRMSLPELLQRPYYSFPAQQADGSISPLTNPNAIPEGAIFRFPADINFDAMPLHPYGRMVAKAIQKYGVVIGDGGGAVTLYGENPAGRYAVDPYRGPGGLLGCPNGVYEWSCSTVMRLKGIPWDRLQVLKLQMNEPLPD